MERRRVISGGLRIVVDLPRFHSPHCRPSTGKTLGFQRVFCSGDEEARTLNPRLAKPVLSQLSYVPGRKSLNLSSSRGLSIGAFRGTSPARRAAVRPSGASRKRPASDGPAGLPLDCVADSSTRSVRGALVFLRLTRVRRVLPVVPIRLRHARPGVTSVVARKCRGAVGRP